MYGMLNKYFQSCIRHAVLKPFISSKLCRSHCSKFNSCNLSYRRGISTQGGPENPYFLNHETHLELKGPRWPVPLNLNWVWLRDNCRCSDCYSQETFQRNLDVFNVSLKIRPVLITLEKNRLKVKWPDGHSSEYSFQFLWQNILEARKFDVKRIELFTWNKSNFPSFDQLTIPLESLKNASNKGRIKFMESILKFGIAFVSEVPQSTESTREAVEQISSPKTTMFGDMWTFEANSQYMDSAYSTDDLGAHTDTTYLSEAARIQVFHCLKPADVGGDTLLVDGFNIGKKLQRKDPACYEYLSSTPFPSEYVGDGQHHLCCEAVLKHDAVSKKLVQFRYNLYDRAPLSSIPFNKMDDYFKHLRTLTTFVRNPLNEVWLKLVPGQVLFIDNWRVLHGRSKFKGSRQMTGCYIDNSDFTSKARTLGLNVD